jgi:Tfp pilus assembly protein FimT
MSGGRIFSRGVTLHEMVLVVTLMALLMVALAPYFYTMRTSYSHSDRSTELMQMSRVAMNKMLKEIRQAKRLLSVTAASDPNGRLVFTDFDNNTIEFKKYNDGSREMLGYVVNGVTSPLAGPITSLKFDAKGVDAATSTQVASLIKSVNIELVLHDAEGKVSDYTVSEIIFFRKNLIGLFFYGLYSNNLVTLSGSGTIAGNIHANGTVNRTGLYTIDGTVTDSGDGINVPAPTILWANYYYTWTNRAAYDNPSWYTVRRSSSYTFPAGTVTGRYYIVGTATFSSATTLNGSCVATSGITISSSNVTINPAANDPALVAGGTFSIGGAYSNFVCNGPIYANAITLSGTSSTRTATVDCRGNNDKNALVSAGGAFSVAALRRLTAYGSLISASAVNDLTLSGTSSRIYAQNNWPAILVNRDLVLNGTGIGVTGFVFVTRLANLSGTNLTVNGATSAGNELRYSGSGLNFTSDPNILYNPPPYISGS